MKGKLLVVFCSKHGYVKRYVDIIGNALGCDAVPADKLKGEMLTPYDKILYIGSVRNGEIIGLKKFSEFYDAVYKKLTICGVGLSPFRRHIPKQIKDASVSVTYEKFVPVFYAQGGFDVDELSRTEKFAISWRIRQIKMSEIISDDDTYLMNAVSTPVDEVKLANIQPLIDYFEGKTVSEELYSPPEITDPEEEKKFFEEMEKAAAAPLNKKRALKKKLKKSFGKRGSVQDAEPEESEKPTEAPAEPEAQEAVPTESGETAPTDASAEKSE
ncbi:MAG: hypothetical protein J1G38_07685 [Clostridiales bacterium]|nr:hypothetical protein [Clostridiales bacterium]